MNKLQKVLNSPILFYLFIAVLCLTPLGWFWGRGDVLINGVDTNFPLDPSAWFQRRFFVWNAISNAGTDFSSSTAGIFFHLIQLIPYKLGLPLQQVEMFSVVFWFTMIVLSALSLAKVMFPKRHASQLVLISLYSFNTYLFNTWENIKVANIALVAALPLAIATLIQLRNGRISYLKGGITFIVLGVILSGAGINPAYFATFFLTVVIFILSWVLTDFSRENIVKTVKSFFLLVVIILTINLVWILPTSYFILRNISPDNSINSLGFIDWVSSVSMNTSLLNVLRIQGAWDWYAFDEITGKPYYIPYATTYFNHLPFLLFSFLIPALAILSFISRNRKEMSLYISFGILTTLGVFLGSGTHPPTGAIFRFLALHVPFFSLFRSPWYIFTPVLFLSFAGLIGLLFNNLADKSETFRKGKYKTVVTIAAVIFATLNLVYTHPLINGEIFRPGRQDSFYMKFPSYVFDAKNWLDKKKMEGRVIGYPDDKIENFKWGYRGVDSILDLLTDQEVIFAPFNSSDVSTPALISELYLDMKKGETESLKAIATKLNVQMIFEKDDEDSLIMKLPENIKNLPKTNFGEWNFYDLSLSDSSKIYSPTSVFFGYPYQGGVSLLGVLRKKDVFLNPSDHVIADIEKLNGGAGRVIETENSQVKKYNEFEVSNYKVAESLKDKDLSSVTFKVNFMEDGTFHPIIERYKLEDFGFDLTKDIVLYVDNQKTSWGIDKVTDSWVFLKPQNFTKGEHEISLSLKNDNLIDNDFYKKFESGKINQCDKEASGSGTSFYVIIKNQTDKDVTCDFTLNSFDTMQDYFVQVGYKHVYGYAPKVILDQKIGDHLVKRHSEQLPLSPDWDNFNFYYHPHDSNAMITISLIGTHSSENPLGTKVEFRDLSIKRVFSNKLIFVKQPDRENLTTAKIKYEKISPIEYKGTVSQGEDPHLIVFSENYSPDWEIKLYDTNQKPLDITPKHFSVNLYANAWYIEDTPKNYQFAIFYKPQNIFNLGKEIFIFGTGLILVALIVIKKYDHKS